MKVRFFAPEALLAQLRVGGIACSAVGIEAGAGVEALLGQLRAASVVALRESSFCPGSCDRGSGCRSLCLRALRAIAQTFGVEAKDLRAGFHSVAHGRAILPDSLRWLWRDWRETLK